MIPLLLAHPLVMTSYIVSDLDLRPALVSGTIVNIKQAEAWEMLAQGGLLFCSSFSGTLQLPPGKGAQASLLDDETWPGHPCAVSPCDIELPDLGVRPL